jgi:uncharacterized integral membrane protein (TIGR00698 family)
VASSDRQEGDADAAVASGVRAAVAQAKPGLPVRVARILIAAAPGLMLAFGVAAAAALVAPLVQKAVPIPTIVLALVIGIALNRLASRPAFSFGLVFAVKHVLRWAVALLGLRIALGEIAALGFGTAALVAGAMVLTIVAGLVLARCFGQQDAYGALAGAGTAVCGASAALATATVLPSYPGKDRDTVFVVVAVNALSTVAMLVYPPLCAWLGFDAGTTGIMLGGTIHDVAQVVGAGYSVGEAAGNTAVVVKLYRVFLLLPVVLGIGWWFGGARGGTTAARVPVPVFAFVFLALCLFNSTISALPAVPPGYVLARAFMIETSSWGLLLAIAALGLGTSLKAIVSLGWRQIATVTGTTLVILLAVAGGLLLLR